jgi:hypothetical protein
MKEVLSREQAKAIILETKAKHPKHYVVLIKRYNQPLYEMVMSFNENNIFKYVSNSQKFFNFCNNITEWPLCSVTGHRLNFNGHIWSYRKFYGKGVMSREMIERRGIKRRGKKYPLKRMKLSGEENIEPLSLEDIKCRLISLSDNYNGIMQKLHVKNPVLVEQIRLLYRYPDISLGAMVYCILNNLHSIPRCKYDPDMYCTFISFNRGFLNRNTKNGVIKRKETILKKKTVNVNILSIEETKLRLEEILKSLGSYQNIGQSILARDIYLYHSVLAHTSNITSTFSEKCYMLLHTLPQKTHSRCKLHYTGFNNGFEERFLYSGCSKGETEVFEFVKSLGLEPTKHRIEKQEIDIFIESKKIGIEYNGEYYHSCKFVDKNRHLNKTLLMLNNNIKLIQIWESEWYNKQDIVKSMIKNKLGKTDRKLYARQCNVRELSSEDKGEFLKKNHIQGNDRSHVALGLYHEYELVCVMTFGSRKITGSKTFELLRFCNTLNTTVIGGASKLFKYFVNNYWNGENITTYCDIRFSPVTTFYESLGFKLKHRSVPNYFYFRPAQPQYLKLLHRSNFMKHNLHKKIDVYDKNKTEYENMRDNGYLRVYDCGNYVFTYAIKDE